MHRLRLALLTLLFAVYSLLFGVLWLNRMDLQLIAVCVTLLLCLIRIGPRKTLGQLALITPFIITMLLVYGLFIILGINPGASGAWDYWFAYGFVRLMLLISTLLLFRFFVSLLSYEGLLLASGNIHWQKYLILGKILYQAAFRSLPRIRYWQSMIPSAQIPSKNIRFNFKRALALSLALTLFVLKEARRKGELIENRINTCHKELS